MNVTNFIKKTQDWLFPDTILWHISPSNIISGFKKADVYPVNRSKVLLSSDNSANKQDTYCLYILYNHDHNIISGDINADNQSVIAVDQSVNTADSSAVSPNVSVGSYLKAVFWE